MAYYNWSGYFATSTMRDIGTPTNPNAVVYYDVYGLKSDRQWYGARGDALYGTGYSDVLFLDKSAYYYPRFSGISEFHLGSGNDVLDFTSTRFTYGSITVFGDSGNDWILANNGNDSLYGGSGNDRLKGYGGNDYFEGGTGADYLFGGTGIDTASYAHATSYVIADLSYTARNWGEAYGDYYNSIENLTGSAYDDDLYGNIYANTLSGGAGSDLIYGNAGSDTIFGGLGIDYLYGETGDDTIYGDAGNDFLNGGSGADRLIGGTGSDYLTGGTGRDAFYLNATPGYYNVDRIADFNPVDDTIYLDRYVFTGIRTWSAAAFSSNYSGNALDYTDRIIYEYDTGKLFYDPDGAGGAAHIQIATLSAHLNVTAQDFVLY